MQTEIRDVNYILTSVCVCLFRSVQPTCQGQTRGQMLIFSRVWMCVCLEMWWPKCLFGCVCIGRHQWQSQGNMRHAVAPKTVQNAGRQEVGGHGPSVLPCGNALIHHRCGQAAKFLVLIFSVEKTDYTESFHHSNEVLTLMLVKRFKVILGKIPRL